MHHGLHLEVVVLVRIRGAENGDHAAVVIEQGGVERVAALLPDGLLVDEIPLVAVDDVLVGILVHAVAHQHAVEHVGSRGLERLALGRIQGDVRLGHVADVLHQAVELLGIELAVIVHVPETARQHRLDGVDLVGHHLLPVGVVALVDEEYADGGHGYEGDDQRHHQHRADAVLVIDRLEEPLAAAGKGHQREQQESEQGQEHHRDGVVHDPFLLP